MNPEASPWSRYALVLVDLQHDFWSEAVAATAPELPDRVAALLACARADGLTVVHVRARFRPDGRDWMARYRLRNWIPCIDGTPGVETLSFATELPEEPVVTKQSFDPVGMLEDHLAVGWEYDVEVVVDVVPVDTVARCLPGALGRLEPVDAETTRLVGSTSNPVWYAEQLAAVPASYRIVRCPELQEAARVLGQRLLAAGERAGP